VNKVALRSITLINQSEKIRENQPTPQSWNTQERLSKGQLAISAEIGETDFSVKKN
jgi:hypothetical protein